MALTLDDVLATLGDGPPDPAAAGAVIDPVVDITPDAARRLLATKHPSRPFNEAHAAALADTMRTGNWRSTIDPDPQIVIGADGRLLGGQHILAAVIRSGVTIQASVRSNIDPTTYHTHNEQGETDG